MSMTPCSERKRSEMRRMKGKRERARERERERDETDGGKERSNITRLQGITHIDVDVDDLKKTHHSLLLSDKDASIEISSCEINQNIPLVCGGSKLGPVGWSSW